MDFETSKSEEGRRKKKKTSFLQQVKKFARGSKGIYGKGRTLTEEEYAYYVRVLEQLRNVEDDEKHILIKNFFRELRREGQERSLACNQIISRLLDDALPLAPVSEVVALTEAFQDDIRTLCNDPFASHIVQTLLNLSLKYIQAGATQTHHYTDDGEKGEQPVSSEEKVQLKGYLMKVIKFIYNNLDEFIQGTYASHVIRSILEICSGIELQKSMKSSNRYQTGHNLRQKSTDVLTVPDDLYSILKDIISRLTRIPNLPDLIWSECGSAVLQSALFVAQVKEPEKCAELAQHILQHGLDELGTEYDYDAGVDVHGVFTADSSVRLLEAVLSCADSSQQKQIFDSLFTDQISYLVKHPRGNFAVQRLLQAWKSKDEFEEIYAKVSSTLEEALSCGHTGVIWSLVQACGNLNSQQSGCLKDIMKLLRCIEPETKQLKLAPLLLYLIPEPQYEEYKAKKSLPRVSFHGTLILQELLKFQKPIKVINSILEMSDSEIMLMATGPRSSHVFDAYVDSSSVGQKSREKLVFKLRGSFATLACDKFGSRTLESLWRVSAIKLRSQICSELLDVEKKTKDSQYGVILYHKFQVALYKKSGRSSDWQELQQKEDKKRKLFTDLLKDNEDTEVVQSSPKKKKKGKENSPAIFEEQTLIDTTTDDIHKNSDVDNELKKGNKKALNNFDTVGENIPKKKKKKKRERDNSPSNVDDEILGEIVEDDKPNTKKKKKGKRNNSSSDEDGQIINEILEEDTPKNKKKKKKKENVTSPSNIGDQIINEVVEEDKHKKKKKNCDENPNNFEGRLFIDTTGGNLHKKKKTVNENNPNNFDNQTITDTERENKPKKKIKNIKEKNTYHFEDNIFIDTVGRITPEQEELSIKNKKNMINR